MLFELDATLPSSTYSENHKLHPCRFRYKSNFPFTKRTHQNTHTHTHTDEIHTRTQFKVPILYNVYRFLWSRIFTLRINDMFSSHYISSVFHPPLFPHKINMPVERKKWGCHISPLVLIGGLKRSRRELGHSRFHLICSRNWYMVFVLLISL